MITTWKPYIVTLILSLPPLIFLQYLNYKYRNVRKQLQKSVDKPYFKYIPYCSFLYLNNIVNMINQAKFTISLCMYHLSVDDFQSALLNASSRGVIVRIITDQLMVSNSGSKVNELANKGLEIKTQSSRVGLMHHKYMIIDEDDIMKTKVIFGSLNYTFNALINNWEFVILTNSMDIARRFKEEFNYLWTHEDFANVH